MADTIGYEMMMLTGIHYLMMRELLGTTLCVCHVGIATRFWRYMIDTLAHFFDGQRLSLRRLPLPRSWQSERAILSSFLASTSVIVPSASYPPVGDL